MSLTSSLNSFKELSNSMNEVLCSFEELYEKVLAEHNENACKVTQVCYDLHMKFHNQMGEISIVYHDSVNSLKNIVQELNIAQEIKELDSCAVEELKSSIKKLRNITKSYEEQTMGFYAEAVKNNEEIKKEKTSFEEDQIAFDFLEKLGWGSIPENSSTSVIIGHFFLSAIAVAVNGIFQIINFSKRRKSKRLEALLAKLIIKSQDLLSLSKKFNDKLQKNLTDIDDYTLSVDKILKYKAHPVRVLLMAKDLIVETEALQEKFKGLSIQAIQNKEDLSDKLIRINPRGLIDK